MKDKNENVNTGIVPNAKRDASYICQPQIKILVGENMQFVLVHLDKITKHSTTFLNYTQTLDNEQVIVLQDVDEETMDIIVHWLYSGQLTKIEPALIKAEDGDAEARDGAIEFEDDNEDNTDQSSVEFINPAKKRKRFHSVRNSKHEVATKEENEESMEQLEEPGQQPTARSETSRADGVVSMRRASSALITSTPDPCVTSPGQTSSCTTPAPSFAITASNLNYHDLVDVYAFAVQYDFPQLKLEAMKCWQRLSYVASHKPDVVLIEKVLTKIKGDKNLARYIATGYAKYSVRLGGRETPDDTEARLSALHPQFLPLVMSYQGIVYSAQVQSKPYFPKWCDFHDHANKEDKLACQAAEKLELSDIEMRKRKGCWEETDELKKRIKMHAKSFKKWTTISAGKHIGSLMPTMDDSCLLLSMPEEKKK